MLFISAITGAGKRNSIAFNALSILLTFKGILGDGNLPVYNCERSPSWKVRSINLTATIQI